MTPRPIRILPQHVAERIAAGEVIERSASAVKELVENALDADARNVRVDVRGAGFHLIRVSDDGIGIPPHEVALALQRYATSKLPDEDLTTVQTLGFRGEALPSIAAMADLTIVSAVDDSGVGRRVVVRSGRVVTDEPAARARGTTVTVRHLFANVPARLAASARPQVEGAALAHVVRQLAIAAPAVRISLIVDDRERFHTTGSGDVRTALLDLYGAELQGRLLQLGPARLGDATLTAVLAGPEVTRPGRSHITVCVNGRAVQPRSLLLLVENAYRPLLPRGRHPLLTMHIRVPPDQVDINIHPSKLEVRLLHERAIGSALGEMVVEALSRQPLPLQFPTDAGHDPLSTLKRLAEESPSWDIDRPIITPGLPPLRVVGQVHDRLLLVEEPGAFYLIDQHRAHERVLYEQLMRSHDSPTPPSESLIDPVVIELGLVQAERFRRRLKDLESFGFHCETFGPHTFLVRGAPPLAGIGGDTMAALGTAGELAEGLVELVNEESPAGEGWSDRLLVRLACRIAVRRGTRLDAAVMRALIDALGHTHAPAVCPHGSPLLMEVTARTLERQFRW